MNFSNLASTFLILPKKDLDPGSHDPTFFSSNYALMLRQLKRTKWILMECVQEDLLYDADQLYILYRRKTLA